MYHFRELVGDVDMLVVDGRGLSGTRASIEASEASGSFSGRVLASISRVVGTTPFLRCNRPGVMNLRLCCQPPPRRRAFPGIAFVFESISLLVLFLLIPKASLVNTSYIWRSLSFCVMRSD